MSKWKVESNNNNSVELHETWSKDGMTIRVVHQYASGSWEVTKDGDAEPEFVTTNIPRHPANVDGINMLENGYTVNILSLDNLIQTTTYYPEDLDQVFVIQLNTIQETDRAGWVNEGWIKNTDQCWTWGNLTNFRIG